MKKYTKHDSLYLTTEEQFNDVTFALSERFLSGEKKRRGENDFGTTDMKI